MNTVKLQVVKVYSQHKFIYTVYTYIDIICFVKYFIYQLYSLTLTVKLQILMYFIYEKKIVIIQFQQKIFDK